MSNRHFEYTRYFENGEYGVGRVQVEAYSNTHVTGVSTYWA